MSQFNQPNTVLLNKGLYLDAQTSYQPEGTYPFALNIVNRDEHQNNFKSNEHGNFKLENFKDVIGDVFMKDSNESFFITKDANFYIYNYDTNKKTHLGSFGEFGCSMSIADCEYVKVVYTTKGCDKYVYWSSNNIYYWINISEFPQP
jgi:hypothetical protein